MDLLHLAGIGGIAGLAIILVKYFDNRNVEKKQGQLESKVTENDKKEAELSGEQKQEDKETKEKVDDLEKEKNKKLDLNSLSDWFNRRK